MKRFALAAALLVSGTAHAQEWRTLDVARQLRDSQPLNAKVIYGAGTFRMGAASEPDLYEMKMRYQAGRTTPIAKYDPSAHALNLGIESKTFSIPGGNVDQNECHVNLARGVPLNLVTEVGAADVKIDLGSLAVHKLLLKTGAADATLAFSSPNAMKMESMELNVGAAGFKATGLANARADRIVLRAGVGDWDLYFDGDWTGDITLDAKVGLGSLTVHVPNDVRVDENAKAVLGAVTGDNNTAGVAADSSDDDSESADDNSDSNASTSVAAAKAAKIAAAHAKVAAKAAVKAAKVAQANAAARYTLHILGGATLGQINFDHKLAGSADR